MPPRSAPPKPIPSDLLSSKEACEVLGIKPATLYTYVSRGLLKPIRQPNSNANRYRRDDLESLQLRVSVWPSHLELGQ